ncbi:MAG: D-alanyl-D-alanine carboxypeptidase/D-alanyl-D-alanine-endopeptidase, partial [candidate division Zixibacteria bacterium RBG_16_40_9]
MNLKKLIFIGLISFGFSFPLIFAEESQFKAQVSTKIDSLLTLSEFSNINFGITIYSLDDKKMLYEKNSSQLFVPASNMKLVTSACVLSKLGPDFQFKTEIYSVGDIQDGTLRGNLILKGYADPTISGRFKENQVTKVLEEWADSLKRYRIEEIEGDIYADESYFDTIRWGPGWSWDDLSYWYAAEISALSFNDNCVDLYFKAAKIVGGPVQILINPNTRYIKIYNNALTSSPGTPKTIDYFRLPFGNTVTIFGNIPQDDTSIISDYASVHDPASYTVFVFKEVLQQKKLKVKKNKKYKSLKISSRNLLFRYYSPPLTEVIKVINKRSQNFFADCVLKTLGQELKAQGSFEGGVSVILDFLTEIGIPENQFKIYDGSGLSYMNLLTPNCLIKLLEYMYQSPHFNNFYESMAIPGVDKGVERRMNGLDLTDKMRVKTGFITNAICYSGYLKDKTNRPYAFSIMVNNYTVDKTKIWELEDKICQLILNYEG